MNRLSTTTHRDGLLHLALFAHPGGLFERRLQVPLFFLGTLGNKSRALGQLSLGEEPRLDAG